jgi:dephospho-CoA kinase
LNRNQGIKESRSRARKALSRNASEPSNPRILESSNPIVVGVGGNAGSGKSTFVKELARLGARTIDADRIGWELLKKGTPTARQTIRQFGADILDSRGNIDRKKLGAIVFAKPAARLRLNRIVHPALLREIQRQARPTSLTPNPRSPTPVVVIDAALLFLWNWQRKVHLAVLITSTRANKLRRLTGRGLTLTAARNRLASQLSEAEMRPRADLVIPNNGTIAELRVRARRFYRLLQSEL